MENTTQNIGPYNLQQYTEQVVKKTLLVKEKMLDNKIHMVLGMGSEFMSELTMAQMTKNTNNIIEELGDLEFFVVGFAIFEEIELPQKIELNVYQKLICPLLLIETSIGDLQTIIKKELVSGVQKLNGVVVTKQALTQIVFDLLAGIQIFASLEHLSLERTIRPANARKLNVRYDGGGFTAEHSLNRNTDAEMDAMSQKDLPKEYQPHECDTTCQH